jgi:RNA polymerase sigma-70 factor (ECF subfamily)
VRVRVRPQTPVAPRPSILGFRSTAPLPSDRHVRIRAMVDEHLNSVARTLQHAGVPSSDLDDEIQRTFIIAAKRIDDIQVGAERSFLIQVAQNLAWHARRQIARRREVLDGNPPERIEAIATPEFLAGRKQMRQLFDDILGSLHESLRVVFTLFELEEMSMSDIAETLGLPRGTVASRLRRARVQFRQHVAALELAGMLPDEASSVAEPMRLSRERMGTLQHALLAAGAPAHTSASTYAKTLAALGLAGLGS